MTGNAMIIDTPENRPLPQYPRNIIRAAVQYMKDLGIADTMKILPEFEFYLFDDVTWGIAGDHISATVDAKQSYWNSDVEGKGVIVPKQKNYHIAKPFDISYECRSEMCMLMEDMGIEINYHHPEVAASGQFEIEPQLGEVVHMADATMMIKYIIHNTALKYGKSATFMPKPIYGEAGSGMHVHMLLMKDGAPVFADDAGYANLSKEAHWFMGGLLKHIASLCALTNPAPTPSSVWCLALRLPLPLVTQPLTVVLLSVFLLMPSLPSCAASSCVTPMQPATPTSATLRS